MDVRCAKRFPTERGISRIQVEDGLAAEIAFDQANAAAAANVDRRIDDQPIAAVSACGTRVLVKSMNARRNAIPASELFSGWN